MRVAWVTRRRPAFAAAATWLRDNLAAWGRPPDKGRPEVAQWMQQWLSAPDFDGVRGPNALAKLPRPSAKSGGSCGLTTGICSGAPGGES